MIRTIHGGRGTRIAETEIGVVRDLERIFVRDVPPSARTIDPAFDSIELDLRHRMFLRRAHSERHSRKDCDFIFSRLIAFECRLFRKFGQSDLKNLRRHYVVRRGMSFVFHCEPNRRCLAYLEIAYVVVQGFCNNVSTFGDVTESILLDRDNHQHKSECRKQDVGELCYAQSAQPRKILQWIVLGAGVHNGERHR